MIKRNKLIARFILLIIAILSIAASAIWVPNALVAFGAVVAGCLLMLAFTALIIISIDGKL